MGLFFAVIAAILFAVREGFTKQLTKKTNVYLIFWAATLLSSVVFFIGMLIEGMPVVRDVFWLALAANTPLFLVTSLLLIRAVQISPLSLTVPLLSFSPLFMLLTSWLMLGEFPTLWALVGIILIPLGAFLLNVKHLDKGILAPIKAIKSEKGSLYALAVAFIWSITSNSDKIAIQNSSTFFYLFTINLFITIILTLILIKKHGPMFIKEAKKNVSLLTATGIFYGSATAFQMLAIQETLVPYVIAIKRAGLILGGIIIGTIFFKEKDFRYRIIGGLVMTIGVLLILIFN